MPHDSAYPEPLLFADDDVRSLDAAWAVNVMADAVRAHTEDRLAAPARVSADVTLAALGCPSAVRDAPDGARGARHLEPGAGEGGSAREDASLSPGRIVMTAGRTREWFGYRVYDTVGTTHGQQVVVAHDGVTGDVAAIAVGSELGAYRTGALGGLSLRELVRSRRNASSESDGAQPVRLAIVGAGQQAWTQLWAAAGVLDIADVRVASRTPASSEAFCERARRELEIDCTPTESVCDAVRGADVVILATTSPTPVLDAAWLEPDCVVVTLGPKQEGRAEFGLDLLDGAFVITDSTVQLHAYDPPALASQNLSAGAVVPLDDLVAGRVEPPASGRRVYLSVGLAGTEVALLAAMAAAHTGGAGGALTRTC